jgi:hypothetical protein
MMNIKYSYLLALMVLLGSCRADLRPKAIKTNPDSKELEAKGKALLQTAYKAHGVENLLKHEVYQFTATDDWKGLMGGMGKLWPQKNTNMTFKFATNTFDSQVKFNDGKTTDHIVGIQSWQYYEKDESGTFNFAVKKNDRHVFGLAAFQYFTELVGRMPNAEIIRAAGQKEVNGVTYDLVYVTWKTEVANIEVDQYILYINKATSILEYATYTIRDNYLKMPGSSAFYGTIRFSDFQTIDGFKVPFTQTIVLNNPKKNIKKYIHQLKLTSFSFDGFDKADLYPNKSIRAIGDNKLKTN